MSTYNKVYNVTYEDGTSQDGGTLEYPGWGKLAKDKRIKALELNLPNLKDKIILEGYDLFNFFIGVKKPINRNNAIVSHMYGLGHRNGIVTSYRITLISQNKSEKHKVGDVTVRKFPWGKEGIGRTATTGWKEGAS